MVNIIEDLSYLMSHFSLGALLILFLPLANSSLTMMCLYVDLFEFILFGVHRDSWMCILFFIRFVKYSAYYIRLFVFCPFFLFSPPEIPIMCILVSFAVSQRAWRHCSFFPHSFFYFSDWIISFHLSLSLFCPFSVSLDLLLSSGEFFI